MDMLTEVGSSRSSKDQPLSPSWETLERVGIGQKFGGVTAPPVQTQVTIYKASSGVGFPVLTSPGYILGKLRHGHECKQTFLIG